MCYLLAYRHTRTHTLIHIFTLTIVPYKVRFPIYGGAPTALAYARGTAGLVIPLVFRVHADPALFARVPRHRPPVRPFSAHCSRIQLGTTNARSMTCIRRTSSSILVDEAHTHNGSRAVSFAVLRNPRAYGNRVPFGRLLE